MRIAFCRGVACITHAVFVHDVLSPVPRDFTTSLSMSRNAWHSLDLQQPQAKQMEVKKDKKSKGRRTQVKKIASNIKRETPTKPNQWSFLGPPLVIWAQLLEAWLALTSVWCHDNVLVLILFNQWLKLTMLWATQPWALRVCGSALALSAYRPWALSLSGSTLSPLGAPHLWIRP